MTCTLFATIRLWHRRVPYVPQLEAADCGASALAMVLAYHGRFVPMADLRNACGVTRDGVNAYDLLCAAGEHGLRGDALRAEPEDLAQFKAPVILHWAMNHFVVLERVDAKGFDIVDPAVGRRRVPATEFERAFTGIVLDFVPAASFQRRAQRESVRPYAAAVGSLRSALLLTLAISMLLYVLALAVPVGARALIDSVSTTAERAVVLAVCAGLLAAALARALLSLMRARALLFMQRAFDEQLLFEFVRHMMHLPLRFFFVRFPADLAQRVHNTTVLREIVSVGFTAAAVDLLVIASCAVAAFLLSAYAGVALLAFAAVRVLIAIRTARSVRSAARAELTSAARESEVLLDAVEGLETIHALDACPDVVDRWTSRNVDRMNYALQRRTLEAFGESLGLATTASGAATMLLVSGTLALNGSITVGTCAMLILLQSLAADSISTLPQVVTRLQYLQNHLFRMNDVMLAAPERTCGIDAPVEGALELIDVCFQYGPSSTRILDCASARVLAGEKVLITGRIGSGKSTLAKLICGLVEPTGGVIRSDGHRLDELNLRAFRRQIGVALQESRIIDASIQENIAFYDERVAASDVVWAAEVAGLLTVVDRLPGRFEYRVGEDGKQLSGGERQRLVVARALARRPALLILDEPTSSMDARLAREFFARLRDVSGTQIVISHGAEAVAWADRVLQVENGRILDDSSPGVHMQAVS